RQTEVRSQVESQAAERKTTREQQEQARKDITMFAQAMPADPRGTPPGIRAASFTSTEDQLNHEFLAMQDQGKTALCQGKVDLTGAGRYTNRRSGHIDLPAFDLELERYTHVDGNAAMPEGFTPREVTIKTMRYGSDKVVGTRTIRVVR